MAAKLLDKKFGIKDVTFICILHLATCVLQASAWMKEKDVDKDGRLNFKEFKSAIRAEIDKMNESD